MNTDLQKANGPASVGALPDRGSNIPNQETKMNSTTNSTGAADPPVPTKPNDAAVASAMRELESAIRELMHMSDIAAESYDQLFGPANRKSGDGGQSLTYRITKHEDDQMAFLVNNVASRCSKLHKSFEAAWKGEVLA